MKTLYVKIKDFKNLHDFEADLKGQNVVLLGDNEVGKTSFLQFIEIALGNQKVVPPGITGSGEVIMEIEGKPVIFKLDIKDGKPCIKVSGQGISIDNKKGAIASLVGAVEFDVAEFVDLSKTSAGRKKQVDDFKKFLDQEVIDLLNKCESNIKNLFEERAQTNKDIKNLEGAVKLNPMYNHSHELDKFCPIDIQSVITERDKAQAHNATIIQMQEKKAQTEKEIDADQLQVKELEAKIKALNDKIDANIQKINTSKEWFKVNTTINVSQFDEVINNATETNKKASDAEKLKSDYAKLKELQESSGEQTVLIETERQMILDTIRDLDSPVEGLSFNEEQLIYNGVAVDGNSLSTSTIGELGVKLKRAENPNIPILLRCGESWGSARIKWLQELSKKENFQVIMEKVDTTKDKLTIEIMAD